MKKQGQRQFMPLPLPPEKGCWMDYHIQESIYDSVGFSFHSWIA